MDCKSYDVTTVTKAVQLMAHVVSTQRHQMEEVQQAGQHKHIRTVESAQSLFT